MKQGSEIRIVFVQTPMASISVLERRDYWYRFDEIYKSFHPGLRPMRNSMWELPHWMTWLGGVLDSAGYRNLGVMDLLLTPCDLDQVDEAEVARRIADCPADIYLFSPMTPNLHFAAQIAGLIKTLMPESICVFGGVVATPIPEMLAALPGVDYVIHGRGEIPLVELLDQLTGEKDLDRVSNLCFRGKSGEVLSTPRRPVWVSPERLPFPRIDLFPADTGLDLRYLRVVHGLGCPYRCPMCTIQTIGTPTAYFPIPRVLAEIRGYKARYGMHHNIYFGDETFTTDRRRTLALCEALIQDEPIQYDCQTRLNLLTDATLLRAMERSGCRWVEVGIESIDQSTQNVFKQRMRLGSLRDTLSRVRDAGLATCAFLINGFPNQTLDDMRRSIDGVCELITKDLLCASYLFGLVPYPGSDLYRNPNEFGLIPHGLPFKFYNEDLPPVYDTPYAKSEQIYGVLLSGLRSLASAMRTRSRTNDLAETESADCGTFWNGAHV